MGFFGGSLLATFLFGVSVGDAILGLKLNERGVFIGNPLDLVNRYSVLVGLLSVSAFAMHGAQYLYLKIPHGELHQRIGRWTWHTWGIFLVSYMLATTYTLARLPGVSAHIGQLPGWAGVIVVLDVLAIANIPRATFGDKPAQAFVSSCAAIVGLVALFAIPLWPNLIVASNDPANSLTVYNAASSQKTLLIMFIIAAIGMPIVLTYTTVVYWTFRRRVEIGQHSY